MDAHILLIQVCHTSTSLALSFFCSVIPYWSGFQRCVVVGASLALAHPRHWRACCLHVCMFACLHVCMFACLHVCMFACLHVCMFAC
ncbi:hypothetical protein B484DRAFT_341696, partial [Ochromonadaceae sp. CCMP2298]